MMKSQKNQNGASQLPLLSVTELEVLWLYDCKFSDSRISNLLFLKEHELVDIKNKLYKTFEAVDTNSLLTSASDLGYVHNI